MALTNAQYDSIIRTYNQKKLRAELEAQQRVEYINENLPGYKQISDSIASFGVTQTKKLLSGDKDAALDIEATINNFTQMKIDLLVGAGYPADYLEPHYECPDCKDTGYIDGQKCHCFKQKIISLLYSQSNIEKLLKEDNFSNLSYDYHTGEHLEAFKSAANAAHNFVDNFNKDYQNLLFYGTVGTGKSFLSGCIAKALLDDGNSVIYFSAVELFEVLSDVMFNHGDKEELRTLRADLYDCDLLIIDDLGTELTNSAVATQLFSLLNERHLLKKSTIISSNLSLNDLKDRYDDRVFSRIAERFSIYKLSGDDIRRLKRRAKSN